LAAAAKNRKEEVKTSAKLPQNKVAAATTFSQMEVVKMSKELTLKEIVATIGMTYASRLQVDGWVEAQAFVPKLNDDEWHELKLYSESETIDQNMLETAKALARKYGVIIYVMMAEFTRSGQRGLLVSGYTPFTELHLLVPVRESQDKYLPVIEESSFGTVEEDSYWLDPWYKDRTRGAIN
jgi:hypothetical protein